MRAKVQKLTVFNCLCLLSFKLYLNHNTEITPLNERRGTHLSHQVKLLIINRLNCINKYENH